MSLLFDHRLSRWLVKRLADVFPNASHVALHGLAEADDAVIWVRIGNRTMGEVEGVLRQQSEAIRHFLQNPSTHLLEIIPYRVASREERTRVAAGMGHCRDSMPATRHWW